MEECCGNCAYFVPFGSDKRFGWCTFEVCRRRVLAKDRCGLFQPKKAYSPAVVGAIIQTIAILIGLSIFEDGCRWPRVVVDLAIEEYWRGLSKLLEEE